MTDRPGQGSAMLSARTIPFLPANRAGDRLLPWLIAVMLFLSSLSLVLATGVGRGLERWSSGLATTLSVQLVEPDRAVHDRQKTEVLAMLRATPGVEQARVMAESQVMDMLSPWLGDLPRGSGLPVPTLIDVTLKKPGAINPDALAERLKAIAPGARLDDHKAWLSRLLDLARLVQMVLLASLVMVVLATVAIVVFGCRAGLASHRGAIEIMHLMGAEDGTIARAFDERYLWYGLKGGIIGVALAALALYGIITLAGRMGEGLLTAALPGMGALWWLILLPPLAGGLTMLTARVTVRRALARMV
ncbi:cell division protein FtsX [Yunchengibacter salinarum]|uniref:cell division protein FtsX n=1 Tax=Yunchengibacter salinarum TaxID=3133399 RepID=UPI0035B64688